MPVGIYVRTEKIKKYLRELNKGRKHTKKQKENQSMLYKKLGVGNWMKGRTHSLETRLKLSIAQKGKVSGMKGKKHSKKTRIKMSKSHSGSKCNLWKGGITPINTKIRNSIELRLWRDSVFERDNWTCQECGQIGGKIQDHHIKSFSRYPNFRFELDNGITLCKECHKKTDTYLKHYKKNI